MSNTAQFPVAEGQSFSNKTVSDGGEGSADAFLANDGHRTWFVVILGWFIAYVQWGLARLGGLLYATSTTSRDLATIIGAGSTTLDVGTGKGFGEGQYITAHKFGDVTKKVFGQVTGYTDSGAGALAFTIEFGTGTGTVDNWVIRGSGPRGATGPAAAFADLSEGQGGVVDDKAVAPDVLHQVVLLQGVHVFTVDARLFEAHTTNGASRNTDVSSTNKWPIGGWSFDHATAQHIISRFALSKAWNGSTIRLRFIWRAASGTGGVVWGGKGVSIAHDGVLDTAAGTGQLTAASTLTAAGDQVTSGWTAAITLGGSPGDDTLNFLDLYREVSDSGDNLAAAAVLMKVQFEVGVNAGNDA